jgi:hypothetical protein
MNCDNCGKLILDEDEILCRGCKPSLQIKADIKKALADISAAHWKFCRCLRALPPSMACPEAYAVLKKYHVKGYH